MHDPMTMIYSCRLFTLWHVDPEKDGTDDSCGWSYPRLTEKQMELCKGLAWSEAYDPWFLRVKAKKNTDPVLCETLMRGVILFVSRCIRVKLSWAETCHLAADLIHCPLNNFRGSLCHLPGYHTNREKDTKSGREERAKGLFVGVAHHILRGQRPWWRHPRWHVHHWRLQIHPVQSLKRWLFSRCCRCGKGFKWGEAPVSCSWDNDGPRWFRGEPNIHHSNCKES